MRRNRTSASCADSVAVAISSDAPRARQVAEALMSRIRHADGQGGHGYVLRMPPTSGRATNRRFNSLLGARHSVALMVKRSADLQVRIMIHERTWRSALRRKEAPRSG